MFDKRGDKMPPGGVPFAGKPSPIISAFNRREIVVNIFLYYARLDPYIRKFVSNTVSYCILHCILTIFVQPKHHDLHHPSQPDCYGKFSHLLAKLITLLFLLNSVLFDAGEPFKALPHHSTPRYNPSVLEI